MSDQACRGTSRKNGGNHDQKAGREGVGSLGFKGGAPRSARFQPGSLKYRGHRPYTPLQECCQANFAFFRAFLFRRLARDIG